MEVWLINNILICPCRFTEYQQELVNQKKEQFRNIAVFPCKLRIMPENIFARRDPIVVGVKVEAGVLRTGTPICVPSKEFLYIGVCTGIQHNNIEREQARKGDEVQYIKPASYKYS